MTTGGDGAEVTEEAEEAALPPLLLLLLLLPSISPARELDVIVADLDMQALNSALSAVVPPAVACA